MQKAKVDFRSNEINIELSKVPKILYINEGGNGCGQLFIDGVKVEKLVSASINSHTKDLKIHPIKYVIKHYDMVAHVTKTIENL